MDRILNWYFLAEKIPESDKTAYHISEDIFDNTKSRYIIIKVII